MYYTTAAMSFFYTCDSNMQVLLLLANSDSKERVCQYLHSIFECELTIPAFVVFCETEFFLVVFTLILSFQERLS